MEKIKFKLNGKDVQVDLDPSLRLLDVLRNNFNLMGTKEGCGEGSCGACVVLMNGVSVNTCVMPLANAMGKDIVTIEGFVGTKRYEALYKAFCDEGGSQCGFCTPGMILASESLLNKNPHPSKSEIRFSLSGNLCRCTGYNAIVEAVIRASEIGEGLW